MNGSSLLQTRLATSNNFTITVTCENAGYATSGPVSSRTGDCLRTGIPSRYIISQLSQLSLADTNDKQGQSKQTGVCVCVWVCTDWFCLARRPVTSRGSGLCWQLSWHGRCAVERCCGAESDSVHGTTAMASQDSLPPAHTYACTPV